MTTFLGWFCVVMGVGHFIAGGVHAHKNRFVKLYQAKILGALFFIAAAIFLK